MGTSSPEVKLRAPEDALRYSHQCLSLPLKLYHEPAILVKSLVRIMSTNFRPMARHILSRTCMTGGFFSAIPRRPYHYVKFPIPHENKRQMKNPHEAVGFVMHCSIPVRTGLGSP
jgi:hypothetical protein